MKEKLHDRLAYPPRAFRADRAAAYLSISRTKFLQLVKDGKLPPPTYIDDMALWDRLTLELAWENLAYETESGNTFDKIINKMQD